MGDEGNLAVVAAHMEGEATDPASVMALYTDDVLFEVPERAIALRDKGAIEANYRGMFASIAGLSLAPCWRVAEGNKVQDLTVARFELTGDGFVRAPARVGDLVTLALHHVFVLRDGRIAREIVHEEWRVASP